MNGTDPSTAGGPAAAQDGLEVQAERYHLPLLRSVPDEALDPSLVAALPVEWARTHGLLPVRWQGRPCVLTSDPENVARQEELALLVGEDLEPVLAPREVIARSIERCYYSKDDSPSSFMQDLTAPEAGRQRPEGDDLLSVAREAPVTQLVNLMLLEAVKKDASDIHFEPFGDGLRVRYRVDGILYEQASPPRHMVEPLISRLKVMGHMDIAEKRLPQDGMGRVRVGEREIDIRMSTVPVAAGERVVLRLLDRDSAFLPLGSLGMPDDVLSILNGLLCSPNGMLVVSGPTGSGKTTTLYAALGSLDASRRNIMTIEEPIEYQLPRIGQIQVRPKIGLTFARGLRHILRQDPDVVLVGETRDAETAAIAVRAALTGHLVLTTLHTNDAVGSVVRLVDMGVEPYLVASCLRGVLAQRLVRRLCPQCRRRRPVRAEDTSALRGAGKELAGKQVWEPAGCAACLEGYRGRTGLFELMRFDDAMQRLVRGGAFDGETLRAAAAAAGFRDLSHDGARKIAAGLTSPAEVAGVVAPGSASGPPAPAR